MSTTSKWEGEGAYAGLANRLTSEEKAKQVVIKLMKCKELSVRQKEIIREELYDRIKLPEVKKALVKYMDFINYQI
ncbi:MAG: hypothetical protein Q8O03_04500 [Nanoarchaeota archaeon]|nr:hypothetical protein [Nanoarchaeota archaeon]